jgi:hypothetical protein
METVINEFKQQLIVELCNFIGEPNNKETQHQMVKTIHDFTNRFNDEGRHITVDGDLISGFNDIQLFLTIMEGVQTCPDCGFQIVSYYIKN